MIIAGFYGFRPHQGIIEFNYEPPQEIIGITKE